MNKLKKLQKLKNKPFTAKEAEKLNVSGRMLHYYTKKGLLKRISQGVYVFSESQSIDLKEIFREKLTAIPKGIIGLMSAIQFYGLTEEAPRKIYIIVPENNFPKRRLDDVICYRVKKELYKIDTSKKNGIAITNLERTIIDLLRVGKPLSLLIDILHSSQSKGIKISIPKLIKLGKKFRVNNKIKQLLEAIS